MGLQTQDLIERISIILGPTLGTYESMLQVAWPRDEIRFHHDNPLKLIDVSATKPYSFRADVTIRYDNPKPAIPINRYGDKEDVYQTDISSYLYPPDSISILGFRVGDGTGAESKKLNMGNLKIPANYQYKHNPTKVIPRQKAPKVSSELMLPLFSFNADTGDFYPGVVCLEEITSKMISICTGSQTLQRDCFLGAQDPDQYKKILTSQIPSPAPKIYFTTGYLPSGNRFGDPHALLYSEAGLGCGLGDKMIQVVGFISMNYSGSPIAFAADRLLTKGHAIIPRREH